jgi:hypothetical protein
MRILTMLLRQAVKKAFTIQEKGMKANTGIDFNDFAGLPSGELVPGGV